MRLGFHYLCLRFIQTTTKERNFVYMNGKMRRLALSMGTFFCSLGASAHMLPEQTPRDSIVVDSITGDVRRYKHTNSKILKPVYSFYNFIANSNKRRSDINYDAGFVAGPAYSANTSFAIGGGYSALYSMDKHDPTLQKSIVNGYFQASVKGIFAVGVEGHNFTKGDKSRFNYDLTFTRYTSSFWGIGYDTSLNNYHNSNDWDALTHTSDEGNPYRVDSKQLILKFETDYTWRLAENFYLGPKLDFHYSRLYDTGGNSDTMDRLLSARYGKSQAYTIVSTGIGLTFTYDSRDFATNAYRGHYFNLQQLAFVPGLNKYSFLSTDLKYQVYTPMWKKCTLAAQAHGRFNYGTDNIPWTRLASTGNSGMGRGYYYGQFRDNNVMECQLELRQHLVWRMGVVAWVGAINIFESFDKLYMHHTLPTYGFGVRWEFKPRVNVRVDWGFTKTGSSVAFNIGEAF